MKGILSLFLLAVVCHLAFAQTPKEDDLTSLRRALERSAVSQIVVLRMPDNVTTQVGVTPEALRRIPPPTREYTIRVTHSRSALLLQWIKKAKITRTERSPDLRRGLLFLDRDGKEIASIFSDRFGKVGNMDGHNVEFSGAPLLRTIHAVVGPAIR